MRSALPTAARKASIRTHQWSKEVWKPAINGWLASEATSDEVKELKAEARQLTTGPEISSFVI